jgi:hypothetical protein
MWRKCLSGRPLRYACKHEDLQRSKRAAALQKFLRFGHSQRNCGYAHRSVACVDTHPSQKCVTPKQQLKCCSCGGNHTANYRGTVSGKRQWRLLESERKGSAAESMESARACQCPKIPSQAFSRRRETGSRLEPRRPRRPCYQGSAHAQIHRRFIRHSKAE